MSKDRFKELQENIEKHGDGVDISIIKHFSTIDMEAPFMDDFFNQVHSLRSTISKITKLIEDVEHLQHAMLAPQIMNGTKEKLEEKMCEIKLLGHNVRMKVKRMKQIQEIQNPTGQKNVRQDIVEAQIDDITKYFCAVMDKYYQSVIIYRERCKKQIQRQYQLIDIVKTDDEIEELLHNGRFTMFPEIIIETEQAKQKLDHLELRHQELIELENGIRDMHDMFFDVAYFIDSQRNQIDYIARRTSHATGDISKTKNIIGAKKVSPCFHLKLSRKRFVSRLVSLLSRLFPSCI